jgi:hypothetical protein
MSKFAGLKSIMEGAPRADAPRPEPMPKRRAGKREDPDYTQISVYIRKQPYHEVKRRLIGSGHDFSDLVNQLVGEWLLRS